MLQERCGGGPIDRLRSRHPGTNTAMRPLPHILYGILALSLGLPIMPAHAGQTDLCVSCTDPRQTYICRVDTPRGSPGDKALQLYCIIKTAKAGGHTSCTVRRDAGAACDGPVMSHVYSGPLIPEALRSAVERGRNSSPGQETGAVSDVPQQKGGEPDTLVEMTGPAVNAGKAAVRGTGRTIGKIGKKTGQQVGKTARGAKSAARFTYDCVVSFFKDCSKSQ